jgi:hypothetical protein
VYALPVKLGAFALILVLYADFHSFRHVFITSLGKAGVSPKMAQTLARHSDNRHLNEQPPAFSKGPSWGCCRRQDVLV